MLLLTPLWLLALLPWGALVAWSLVRRGRTVAVPFVQLWPTTARPAKRRGWQRPPVAVLLLLASALLAIVAAAGPVLQGERREAIVLIDRGASMSLDLRYRSTGEAVRTALLDRGYLPRLMAVPAHGSDVDGPSALPPTAVDTRGLLDAAIRGASKDASAVVVVTDQDVPAATVAATATATATDVTSTVVRVAPSDLPRYVAIDRVGARATPVPQVMVRLRNWSDQLAVDVTVRSADASVTQRVDLPSAGQSRDAFIDLPTLGDAVEVTVASGQRLGERAFLTRQTPWPRVRAVGPVPPAVARAIEAYGKVRLAGQGGQLISVTADESSLGGSQAVILIGNGPVAIASGPVAVSTDPLTRDLDWPALVAGSPLVGQPPAGFRPLVAVSDRPVLAIETASDDDRLPRLWVALHAPSDPQAVDWAILWTRLFDHLAGVGSDAAFTADLPRQLGTGWRPLAGDAPTAGLEPGYWPGLYAHADGRVLAINPPDVQARSVASAHDWLDQVSAPRATGHGLSLAPGLLLTALALLAIAVWQSAVVRSRAAWQRPNE